LQEEIGRLYQKNLTNQLSTKNNKNVEQLFTLDDYSEKCDFFNTIIIDLQFLFDKYAQAFNNMNATTTPNAFAVSGETTFTFEKLYVLLKKYENYLIYQFPQLLLSLDNNNSQQQQSPGRNFSYCIDFSKSIGKILKSILFELFGAANKMTTATSTSSDSTPKNTIDNVDKIQQSFQNLIEQLKANYSAMLNFSIEKETLSTDKKVEIKSVTLLNQKTKQSLTDIEIFLKNLFSNFFEEFQRELFEITDNVNAKTKNSVLNSFGKQRRSASSHFFF
jgi:NifU-like protein involved in Fe-S cluster formation